MVFNQNMNYDLWVEMQPEHVFDRLCEIYP